MLHALATELSDTPTVSGQSIRAIARAATIRSPSIIRSMKDPVSPAGGLRILQGSLAPGGAVVKSAAVSKDMWRHRGPARVFDGEKEAMEAILAHWYWQYFQQNRWRFLQRTQTAEGSGPDLQTWDLPRILAEIDKQFQKVLASADALKKIPIGEYNDLLEKGTAPDSYRPTLYDFLAHNALEFYAAGEQAASRQEDAFAIHVLPRPPQPRIEGRTSNAPAASRNIPCW